MQLCCMPQLTCFYNHVGFTFAFEMFMFILISTYVYSMLQSPFQFIIFHVLHLSLFCLFLCQGQSKIIGYVFKRVRLSVDSLSSKSSAYFEFFMLELMLITAFSLAVFSTFANLVEDWFYRNLLCNISCLGTCLVLLYILADRN